ncbi:MAG: 30S ribosomal protein S8 [Bacteroidia bacterium]
MDTIGNFLTQLRNAYMAQKSRITTQHSNIKEGITRILKDMGYIQGYRVIEEGKKKFLELSLRYSKQEPALRSVIRVSKPGRRIYVSSDKIPFVHNGLGVAILSTSKGILTDKEARRLHVGGEILCKLF